jgi:hypothetical protein
MFSRAFWNDRRITGALLLLGFIATMSGIVLFGIDPKGGLIPVPAVLGYFQWDMTLIGGGVLVTALGLAVLQPLLSDAGDRVLARLGMCAILIGAGLWLVSEANELDGGGWVQLERDYLLLSCFSMACYGGALLRTRLLPRWVAWISLAWGVVWLVRALFAIVPPVPLPPLIANVVPLLIGITLLLQHSVSVPGSKTAVQGT